MFGMSDQAGPSDEVDDDAAELAALTAAVAAAEADPRPLIPHADVRTWLLEIAAGNFDAPLHVSL